MGVLGKIGGFLYWRESHGHGRSNSLAYSLVERRHDSARVGQEVRHGRENGSAPAAVGKRRAGASSTDVAHPAGPLRRGLGGRRSATRRRSAAQGGDALRPPATRASRSFSRQPAAQLRTPRAAVARRFRAPQGGDLRASASARSPGQLRFHRPRAAKNHHRRPRLSASLVSLRAHPFQRRSGAHLLQRVVRVVVGRTASRLLRVGRRSAAGA